MCVCMSIYPDSTQKHFTNPASSLCELGIFLAWNPPALVVGEMPMETIQLEAGLK